jgi:hypothetical protein
LWMWGAELVVMISDPREFFGPWPESSSPATLKHRILDESPISDGEPHDTIAKTANIVRRAA